MDGESLHVFSDMRFRLKEQSLPDTGCSFVAQARNRGLVEMYDASSASGWNWNSMDFLLVRHVTKLKVNGVGCIFFSLKTGKSHGKG